MNDTTLPAFEVLVVCEHDARARALGDLLRASPPGDLHVQTAAPGDLEGVRTLECTPEVLVFGSPRVAAHPRVRKLRQQESGLHSVVITPDDRPGTDADNDVRGNRTHDRGNGTGAGPRDDLVRDDASLPEVLPRAARALAARHRLEQHARSRDIDYQELVEHAALGIYRSTPEGRLLYANAAMARMLGFTVPELLEIDITRDLYLDPEDRSRTLEEIEGSRWWDGVEVRIRRKDGSVMHAMVAARAVRGLDGKVLYYEGIIEDLTVRRHLEQQLARLRRLEAVERLAGGMAHELNNLFTVMLVNLEMAIDNLPDDDGEVRGELSDVRDALGHAVDLVRKVRRFGAREPLRAKIVDLAALTREVVPHLVPPEAPVAVNLDLPDEPCTVQADRNDMVEILQNLVANAIEAMPEGGALTARVRVARDSEEVRSAPHRPQVLLQIRDTGAGMDPATRDRVFEPFFSTREERFRTGGTGLGMALVHGAVRQHGGTVSIDSTPGEGTTVSVCLPYVDADPEE